jgi:hypothetical protein
MRIGQNDYSAKVIVGFTSGNNMVLYDVIDFAPTKIQIKKMKSAVSSPSNHKVENSSNTTDSSKSIPDSSEKNNPSDENFEKISHSVSSRIVFGTPANMVGVMAKAKGVIEKVKGVVTDKAERKAALEKFREAADHFSVLASNSFAAVETQLRRMGDGTYQRITRQAAQEKVQLIRVAALEKSVGALNSFCIRVITCR